MSQNVLIAGASGIIGRYALTHLAALDDWEVTGLARSRPDDMAEHDFVTVDLLAPDLAAADLETFGEVTHMIYSGFVQPPGMSWAELSALNAEMFEGLMNLVDQHMPNLKRVVLMQGQKYYGSHLGPFKTPTKEDDPRHEPPNFYFDQQDLLAERSQTAAWDWVCLRPHIVCGLAPRSPMNLIMQIGVYGTLCKELGTPLNFPGKPSAMKTLQQANDADLIAKAVEWALTEERCGGGAFNITNGDLIRWENMWPIIAEELGLEPGPASQISLVEFGAKHQDLWRELATREGLNQTDLTQLADWSFSDYIYGIDWDVAANTIKARLYGFDYCMDTEDMMRRLLRRLRSERWIP